MSMMSKHMMPHASFTKEDSRPSDLRTIFITGLPKDVKLREVYLLLRTQDGFVDATVMQKTTTSNAFATFREPLQAVLAVSEFQNFHFDIEDPSSRLTVQLAKSNSRSSQTTIVSHLPTHSKPQSSDKPSKPKIIHHYTEPTSTLPLLPHPPSSMVLPPPRQYVQPITTMPEIPQPYQALPITSPQMMFPQPYLHVSPTHELTYSATRPPTQFYPR
ncbi:uncharacterized protein MONOS_15882 [Monocercomonoides exilis]|uniref:uncharacterized protein n=1 Tax=Monocercomonoides exilis TaxID=2049356 RepID=UPI0035598CAA|nr:hypothetical protein MONOS_15882 [Monocercomonoides exilis]|eukprot:MONOS_15882.1-p1 / transcript=MONOS_15882.1 / gene=MONOS_15882 / organism=Monocercomonoides_exilis_PA203 / gene_product=unspecified product / transcript_product=unspecified product / location=Mono_scaffold01391:661-1365(+) / protein_length=216 / sequence_SO=supercontig / SO=protein_coding / is_pseudo=false